MLQDNDHMEARFVLDIKVGMLDQLEESKICHLTVTISGIAMLTVQYFMIFRVSVMYDPWDIFRRTSPDILFIEDCHCAMLESRDVGTLSTVVILVSKQTISHPVAANHRMVGNPCNLELYAVGFILNRTCKLDVTHYIVN